jgi:general secretion pathway protein L
LTQAIALREWCGAGGDRKVDERHAQTGSSWGISHLNSQDAMMIALPSTGNARGDHVHWWRIIDGQVTQRGTDLAWLHPSAQPQLAVDTRVVGIAPAADTVVHRAQFDGLSPRQAAVAAKLLAAENSILPVSDLHVSIATRPNGSQSQVIVAVGDAAMRNWLDWGARHGLAFDSIVPAALLVPARNGAGTATGTLIRGRIADELIVRGQDMAFVADDVLVDHIAGTEGVVVDATPEQIEAMMIAACDDPLVELRSGAYAVKPPSWFDGLLLRRAAMLTGAILIVSMGIAIARLAVTYADISRLDSAAAAAAARVLDPDPPVEQAVAQLDARLTALGGGASRFSAPLATLVASMEPQTSVAIDLLSARSDGLLSVTLGAPRVEDINPVLLALQAKGYVITAQPRSGTDGRALADITIRSGP